MARKGQQVKHIMKALILTEDKKVTGNHGRVLTNSTLKDWGSPGFSA